MIVQWNRVLCQCGFSPPGSACYDEGNRSSSFKQGGYISPPTPTQGTWLCKPQTELRNHHMHSRRDVTQTFNYLLRIKAVPANV